MAARTALVGDISERSGKSLDWLAGANQSIMGVCYLVGPALAGVLLGHLPITWILWLTAACSGIAALMTWVIRLNAHTIPAEHSSVRGTVTVWRDVVKHPMLRPILIVEIVIAMTVFPYLMVFLPAHFTHTDSPTTMGFALSSYAVGMIAGSIVISAVGERLRRNLLWLVAIGATAIGFLGISYLTVTSIVVVGMFAAGCGNGLLRPIGTVVVTENVPETMRGRVFSLFSALDSFAGPIGLMATTAALQVTDIYHVAVGCSLCAAGMFLWLGIMGYRTLGASQSNLQ
jgi:transporter, major facilitator family protein